MTNRRQFLWTCSTLAIAAGVAPAAGWPEKPVQDARSGQLGFTAFSAQVGTLFRLVKETPSAGPSALTLLKARLLPASPPGAADACYEKFSLMFTGPKHQSLGQDTHRFEHAELGVFEMFIVPVGHVDASQIYYEAVFNRPLQETAT